MAQEPIRQVSFSNGELDPTMRARRDVKNYYASLETGTNIVTSPAGPASRRPGLTFIDYARHTLASVALTGGMVTAPAGGTSADVLTANGTAMATTTDLGALDQVLLVIDFGAPVRVGCVDLVDYCVKDAGAPPPTPPPFTYPWDIPPFLLGPF